MVVPQQDETLATWLMELKKESQRSDRYQLLAEQKHVMDMLNQTQVQLVVADQNNQSELKIILQSSLKGFMKKLQQLNKKLGHEQE